MNKTTVTYTNRYFYDSLGQLIRVDDRLKNKTVLYTYDAGFNMTSEKVYAYTTAGTVSGTPKSRTFTYASGWKDQLVSVNGEALTYDGAGNLLSYNRRTFTWKNGRQLAGTTGNGSTVSYTYDHNGMRVSKTVDGVKHTYVYAGTLLLQEKATGLDLKFSYDSLGNPIAVLYNNGEEYYYVKNLQGDIVGLVNKDGEWVVEYRYDAWGNILSTTGSLATTLGAVNPFRYRGYYYDAETGFYYVSSRYYDPETHRFISPDSILPLTIPHQHFAQYNLYAYCWNNPVNMTDILGFWPEWWQVAVSGVMVVAGIAMVATGVGGVAGGALICAGANSIINSCIAEASGGSATAGWVSGMVTGAICGTGAGIAGGYLAAATDSVGVTCIGNLAKAVGVGFGSGVAGSMTGETLDVIINDKQFDLKEMVASATMTGLINCLAGVGAGMGNAIASMPKISSTSVTTSNVANAGLSVVAEAICDALSIIFSFLG